MNERKHFQQSIRFSSRRSEMQIAAVHVVGARVCDCARGTVRPIRIRRSTRAAGIGAACCFPPLGFHFLLRAPGMRTARVHFN